MIYRLSLTLLTWTCLAITVTAQQVPSDPTSSHIFPAGGRRGEKISVRVGGECLPPLTQFRLMGTGVTASDTLGSKLPELGEPSPRRRPGEVHIYYPKEWQHEIDIAGDAPLGMKLWRLTCARGGTGARPFIVGDLPEMMESESNSTLDRAEEVSLPMTINGQIAGERDLDYFQFEAEVGQVVVIDLCSRRLGSPLEPVVQLYDDRGIRVNGQLWRVGSDPVIALAIPRTGRYRAMIGHLGFQGGPQYVYRATVSTLPYLVGVFPAGGQSATKRTLNALTLTGGASLRELPWEVEFDALPVGSRWRYESLPGMNPVELDISPHVALSEQEGNDTLASSQLLPEACVVDGQFLTAGDEDWFRYSARKDSTWLIQCLAFPSGSDCLPIISIHDANGATLASCSQADDVRQPCTLSWRAPADGDYVVRLRDVQQGIRGGANFIYRLSLTPASPQLEMHLASDFLNVVQGAQAEVELKIKRLGLWSTPVDLNIEGLPEDVQFQPKQIPAGQDTVKIIFKAGDKARPCDRSLTIQGSAVVGDSTLTSSARAFHLGRDSDGVSLGDPRVDKLFLTVRHKPVVRLYCSEAYQYAYRGTIYPYAMEIERLNGFTGPVSIEIADRQIKDLDGIVVQNMVIPADQTKFDLPIYLPETMHINVQAHSNVYAQAFVVYEDEWGQKQSQAFVSEMRCMIRPLPTIVKLQAQRVASSTEDSQTIECRLHLDRTSLFSGPMKVELLTEGYKTEPVTIAAGQSESVIRVTRLPEASAKSLMFRATGSMPGYVSVISEASVPL